MADKFEQSSAWTPYEPTADARWDRRRVVHLHRRAAFAASPSVIERDLADGPQASIGRLLGGDSRVAADDFEPMARTIGAAAVASGSLDRLRAWWFYRMLLSPDPLAERLALLWHNHFATSQRKVQELVYMHEQNELFRQHGRGPFGALLTSVVKHPAMLVWLDADSNRAGHPNENLARELLELFTLGIGNYSEADVKGAARALSGWMIAKKKFHFASARHDDGRLELLRRSGPMDGDELLAALLSEPATARRVTWRLGTMLFGEGVLGEDALNELADELRNRNLDVGWAIDVMLRSRLFFSAENIRSRVLGPAEFIVGALHALDVCVPPPSTLLLADWSSRMGHALFEPPNVGGWREGRAWLSSRNIVARSNFAAALAERRLWNSAAEVNLWGRLSIKPPSASGDQSLKSLANLLIGDAPEQLVDNIREAAGAKPPEDQLSAALAALLSYPEAQLG